MSEEKTSTCFDCKKEFEHYVEDNMDCVYCGKPVCLRCAQQIESKHINVFAHENCIFEADNCE